MEPIDGEFDIPQWAQHIVSIGQGSKRVSATYNVAMLQRHARKRDSKQQTREEFAQINASQMQYAVLPSGQRWL